jgi:ABC-type nitrate/sulfonate/bicarbonate transport system permease component
MTLARLSASIRRNAVSILTVVVLLAAWEVTAHFAPKSPLQSAPIVPPLEYVFGKAIIGLSDYWKINLWAPVPEDGGERTLVGAFLAIGYHSAISLYRLLLGVILGALAGAFIGLALSWSSLARRIFSWPLHVIRMTPLLALIPMFQFWFGANNASAITFIGYAVGVPFIIATMNAASNVPKRYVESALTLGASRTRAYLTVVVPAIIPELYATVLLTLGLAWSALIGAEYIGVQSGLGRMVIWSDFFSDTGRMMVVTLLITLYALASFALAELARRRILRWMP